MRDIVQTQRKPDLLIILSVVVGLGSVLTAAVFL